MLHCILHLEILFRINGLDSIHSLFMKKNKWSYNEKIIIIAVLKLTLAKKRKKKKT